MAVQTIDFEKLDKQVRDGLIERYGDMSILEFMKEFPNGKKKTD